MSKSDLLPIEQSVQSYLATYFPSSATPSFVIGVSGGADSMCLLHVLHLLGVDFQIVHVNYQKRGPASDKDAELVQSAADELNVACEIIAVEPEEAADANFQQWARDVRYNAFQIKAQNIGATGIATAHHQDDQLETILQKIFRGGGFASWSAMDVWDGQLFRPLLTISRQQIEEYCQKKSIPYRDDATNFQSNYARNFLRNEWLPELEDHFPGWRTNILRVKEQAEVFSESLKFVLKNISDDKNRIRRKDFLQLPEKLQKSVLLYYANGVDADAEISRSSLNELWKVGQLQTGKAIQLTDHLELMRDREHLKLVVNSTDTTTHLELQKEHLQDGATSLNGLKMALQPYQNPDFEHKLYLDSESIAWPLRLRQWRSGDRFQPLGMEGHQTVADHLTNRKISAAAKDRALVVESFEETICAVIFPPIENRVPPGTISESAKCSPSTRTCLTFNLIKS